MFGDHCLNVVANDARFLQRCVEVIRLCDGRVIAHKVRVGHFVVEMHSLYGHNTEHCNAKVAFNQSLIDSDKASVR